MSFGTSLEAGSPSLESLQLCRKFTILEINVATQNFDESLVIGRGGFGRVYKATITYGDGPLTVAIKRLDSTSNQGAVEFWAEVKMLTKLRHCHLVSLIGYCNDGQEMILVYDYMPRGTLEDHIHKRVSCLPWLRRLKICIGAAHGLDYLHTGTGINHGIIHRDVKSSNILLDNSLEAKISDFGLSKIGPRNQPCTYVNTGVKGTFGYLDPHYVSTGRLTRKSDVYAFGVVLFEVLCGKRAVDRSIGEEPRGLASWAQDSIKEGKLKQIVDSGIRGRVATKCLKEFAQLADRCLHSHPKQRPTMAEVVVALESVLALQEKVNKTSRPAGGMTIFGRKVPTFVFPSKVESSVVGGSINSWELFFDTLGGENKVMCRFDSETINIATDYFSEANKILQAWDKMYKGILQNGQNISIVGPYFGRTNYDFKNEASILVQLEHENLVNLLGYCIEGTNVLLVFGFAPYASLDYLLYDRTCTILDWNKRYKIALGVARALVYLHKHTPIPIIHGDVNPGNILLDEDLNPKLSGFCYARCLEIKETNYVAVDRICGTYGYMAPEYVLNGHDSDKVDVYSFGVLALEIISGRRAYCNHEVRRNFLEGTVSNIIDPILGAYSSSMKKIMNIILLCTQKDPDNRPKMEEVVHMLLNNSLALPIPRSPLAWLIEEDSDDYDSLAVEVEESLDDYDSLAVEVEESLLELCPR